ncbi:hypothetical protein [Tistrella mobilis]|uniref:hypothetical protein n=1 Tax=Tistrella mobilis TaxID=171437 RepID=UPI00355819DC
MIKEFLSFYFYSPDDLSQWDVLKIEFEHETCSNYYFRSNIYSIFYNIEARSRLHGELEVFITIVFLLGNELKRSMSLRADADLENIQADLRSFYKKRADKFHIIMECKTTFGPRFISWILRNDETRDLLLKEKNIIQYLLEDFVNLANIQNESDIEREIEEILPIADFYPDLFNRIFVRNKPSIQSYITKNINLPSENERLRRTRHLKKIYEYASIIHDDRWSYDVLLTNKDLQLTSDLIRFCNCITPEDIREILRNLRTADDKTGQFYQRILRGACEAISRVSKEHIPTDIVLAGLWNKCAFDQGTGPTNRQTELMERLLELPDGTQNYHSANKQWSQYGPGQRDAWREDLYEHVSDDKELKRGLLDFSCRWLDQVAYQEVEPVLDMLIEDNADLTFLQALAGEELRVLKLRGKTLLKNKLGDHVVEKPDWRRQEAVLPDTGAGTWLGDPATEQAIYWTIVQEEGSFCEEFQDQWGNDEEVLTACFLTQLKGAAKKATDQLQYLARTTRNRFPSLDVDYRQTGKREEGKKTAKGVSLGADILFLTSIHDRGQTLVKRTTLVQVKKRTNPRGTGFDRSIAINQQQNGDLLKQTEHAFYLFLTPPDPSPKLWVTPARLVKNMMRVDGRSSITATRARDGSCSFADFFLNHLIGLWSGDESPDLLNIANGQASRGRTPRFVVEIVVRLQDGER